MKKIIALLFFIVLALILIPGPSFIPDATAHDHHGESCHRDFENPNDCRHPCAHEFCYCSSECVDKCKDSKDEHCRSRCSMDCFGGYSVCTEKCCENQEC